MLQDKVVVVAGVGAGLGRSIAIRAAAAGADVVLAARTEATLAEVADEVQAAGRRALQVPTDLTDPAAVAALAAAAVDAFGGVDLLVHNAFSPPPLAELVDIDLDAVRAGFETELFAALRLVQVFAPSLVARQGAIVLMGSVALRRSLPTQGAYRIFKAGVVALAQSLSTELGPRGVRANAVVPGGIWADALKGYFSYLADERGVPAQQVYDEAAAELDLRRLPEADEVANAVVFLGSDLASAITGQCVDVNSGASHH